MNTQVTISTLPSDIQTKIPLSLRVRSDEYQLTELPYEVQELIKEYLEHQSSVSYGILYDCFPELSAYGDFKTIDNIKTLVLEYIKNFLSIGVSAYPFDPTFGSDLKKRIQSLDTDTQNLLISNEIRSIVQAVASDLRLNILVNKFDIKKSTFTGMDIEYQCNIVLDINGTPSTLEFAL